MTEVAFPASCRDRHTGQTTSPWSCKSVLYSAKCKFLVRTCVPSNSREGCAGFGLSPAQSGNNAVTPRAPVMLSCALSTLRKKSKTAACPARMLYVPWCPALTRGTFVPLPSEVSRCWLWNRRTAVPKGELWVWHPSEVCKWKKMRNCCYKKLILSAQVNTWSTAVIV